MTNLQMMEEIRPLMMQIADGLHMLTARYNMTEHCIQQLKKRHAELDDKVTTLDEKTDDALHDLADAEDDLDVHG